MNKKLSALALFFFSAISLYAQDQNFRLGSPVYPLLERMELKSGSLRNDIYLDALPLSRKQVAGYIDSIDSSNVKLTKSDQYWIDYLNNDNLPYSAQAWDNSRRPILKYFYRSKANLYQVQTADSNLQLFINPVLAFSAGKEQDADGLRYRNTRGVEVRGSIDKKLGFYTYLTDNQVVFPTYIQNYTMATGAVPGEGYWKPFHKRGYDFFNTTAYVTFSPSRHIHLQFGNEQNFIGSGYRSLLLSNFATNYTNLKVTTRIWRFQYQNIFAQFSDLQRSNIKPYPKKFGAFHYLSLDASKFLNIGLFEGIIFHDNQNQGRGFELSYLNPVIFYRSAEQQTGSADNTVVGANLNILPVKKVKLYGQVLFDEFRISELRSGNGWWGNKFAVQAGIKYVDIFGLPNVDWLGEFNLIRPYTYTSDTSGKNYVHYNQMLAHPLGANLEEFISIFTINPYAPLTIRLKLFYIRQGRDTSALSDVGSNPFISYDLRGNDYGNRMLQGALTTTQMAEGIITYQLRHNLFIDLNAIYRKETGIITRNTLYVGGGIRLNFAYPNYDF